jgi:hypothetical protein
VGKLAQASRWPIHLHLEVQKAWSFICLLLPKCLVTWTSVLLLFFLFSCGATTQFGARPPIRGSSITLRHSHTLGRTPLGEWSARRRNLYLTAHNIRKRQTSMPAAGFEPPNPSNLAAAKLRLRRHGHWSQHLCCTTNKYRRSQYLHVGLRVSHNHRHLQSITQRKFTVRRTNTDKHTTHLHPHRNQPFSFSLSLSLSLSLLHEFGAGGMSRLVCENKLGGREDRRQCCIIQLQARRLHEI